MSNFLETAKPFTPAEFADFMAHVPLDGDFTPDRVVLHNTAVPNLAQRPHGFTPQAMIDLRHYYADVQKWNGGPHLFVDMNSIWLFNKIDARGTHSPFWNGRSWGVEMLGDFETEEFDQGDGALVRANAVSALASMFKRLNCQPNDDHFKLHREDPLTTHACPGKHVVKEEVRQLILAKMGQPVSQGDNGLAAKVVVYRKGAGSEPTAVIDATLREGTAYADSGRLSAATGLPFTAVGEVPVRAFVEAKYAVTFNAQTRRVYLSER